MDVHSVIARLFGSTCRYSELINHLFHLFGAQLPRVNVPGSKSGGGDGLNPCSNVPGCPTAMHNLQDALAAGQLNCLGQFIVAHNLAVVPQTQHLPKIVSVRAYVGRLDHYQSPTTGCPLGIGIYHSGGYISFGIRPVADDRTSHHTVLDLHLAYG